MGDLLLVTPPTDTHEQQLERLRLGLMRILDLCIQPDDIFESAGDLGLAVEDVVMDLLPEIYAHQRSDSCRGGHDPLSSR